MSRKVLTKPAALPDKQPPVLRWLEQLGHGFFYLTLRIAGQRGAYLLLAFVVMVYVIFSRKIRQTVRPYLERRFGEQSRWSRWCHTFKLVHAFGCVLVDRAWLGLSKKARLRGNAIDIDLLLEAVEKKRGLVLVSAHVGNWQTALTQLCDLPCPVNLLMKYDVDAVSKHVFDLKRGKKTLKIINVNSFMGGAVEASLALQKGEIVVAMGDRLAGKGLEENFLGAAASFPLEPYALAASVGCPLGVFFTAKTGRKSYVLKVWKLFEPHYRSRDTRASDLQKAVRSYVDSLEEYLSEYPYQWYNFFDFWQEDKEQ